MDAELRRTRFTFVEWTPTTLENMLTPRSGAWQVDWRVADTNVRLVEFTVGDSDLVLSAEIGCVECALYWLAIVPRHCMRRQVFAVISILRL